HLVWRPVRTSARFLPVLAVALIGFVVIFTVLGNRISNTIAAHPEVKAQLSTQTLSSLALPYVYHTSEPPILSKLIADANRPHTYGRMTLLPLDKLLHAAHLTGTPPEEVGAFYSIPFETFNTYSWIGAFYLDFGLGGALLLPALMGFAFTLLVLSGLRRRRLLQLWLAFLALSV